MEPFKSKPFLSALGSLSETRFDRVFKSSISKHLLDVDFIERQSTYWDATAFGLDKVTAFRGLNPEAQLKVLSLCSDDLLRESCFIEMAGLTYTARMSLESSKLEERLFYSLMASEEAKHFCMLRPFVNDEVLARGPDAFTALIGEMIENADREHVIFLVQVLLEGWGLAHFSWMASHCTNEPLRATFKHILKDEARHHAGGLALAQTVVGPGDKRVIGWLESILHMVRVGPERMLAALALVSEEPSSFRAQTLLELEAHVTTRESLNYLSSLLKPMVDPKVMQTFADQRLFEPSFR